MIFCSCSRSTAAGFTHTAQRLYAAHVARRRWHQANPRRLPPLTPATITISRPTCIVCSSTTAAVLVRGFRIRRRTRSNRRNAEADPRDSEAAIPSEYDRGGDRLGLGRLCHSPGAPHRRPCHRGQRVTRADREGASRRSGRRLDRVVFRELDYRQSRAASTGWFRSV